MNKEDGETILIIIIVTLVGWWWGGGNWNTSGVKKKKCSMSAPDVPCKQISAVNVLEIYKCKGGDASTSRGEGLLWKLRKTSAQSCVCLLS